MMGFPVVGISNTSYASNIPNGRLQSHQTVARAPQPLAASRGAVRMVRSRHDGSTPAPFVIAHHLIWTGYGWWLPNDPRGSMSHHIRCDILSELGQLHHGRKRLQPCSREIRTFYKRATPLLKYDLLTFGSDHVRVIADAFREVIAAQRYTSYACAIMPDH